MMTLLSLVSILVKHFNVIEQTLPNKLYLVNMSA